MLWPGANAIAQTQATTIRPLTVGDTVPDVEITNIINHPVSKIQLSQLKGKYIILDFWGRFCSSCFVPLARLDSFQNANKDKVQVITVSDFTREEDVYKLLKRFSLTKNVKLPVLLGSEILSSFFPHQIVSHLVWIGSDGIIKAITGSEYVTQQSFQTLLDNKPIYWPVKNDLVDFDYKKPLLDFAQPEINKPGLLYYSTLTGYIDGIAPPSGTFIDSANNVAVTGFYNCSLLQLCGLAMDYIMTSKRQQFILQVRDSSRYLKEISTYYKEWAINNTYCYYLRSPIDLPAKERTAFIQSDILRWLSLLGIEVKKQPANYNGKQQPVYIITEKQGRL